VVCDHRRGQHPSEPLNSHEERNLVMRHEPSGSCPLVQPTADRRCPPYTTAVARRYRQWTLREVAHRTQVSHLAMLAQHWRGGGDAA
jgi:hypothetical protein